MTTKVTRKMSIMLIAALVLFAAVFAVAKTSVSAGEYIANRPCPKTVKVVFSTDRMNEIDFDNGYQVKLKKCKSTNKKVVKVIKNEADVYCLNVKKPGKAKVTIYAKKKGSKKYKKYTTKVTVYKYKNAFKSFKLNNTEYKSKFKVHQSLSLKKGLDGKVKVKAAKGWKLVRIDYMDNDTTKSGSIKNGSTVKMNNGELTINMKHKASGDMMLYNVDIMGGQATSN